MDAILLNNLVEKYNNPAFIQSDPISIPHQFSNKPDIEISAFIASIFAWGQRTTIINKTQDFLGRMDMSPHDFVMNFEPADLIRFQSFRHRTFNGDDAISILYFFQHVYRKMESLESIFLSSKSDLIYNGLESLSALFRSLPSTIKRSHKHVSSPKRNSACKRLNMFLRWMVRDDENGVDFGIWENIPKSELIIPLDLHVVRASNQLGILTINKADWRTAVALTKKLKTLDASDPVKYDFALFNYSLNQPK